VKAASDLDTGLTFEDVSTQEERKLREKAMTTCQSLAACVDGEDYGAAGEAFVDTLLSVRNARVHAAHKPKKLPVGGTGESNRKGRKQGEAIKRTDLKSVDTIQSVRRADHEIDTVARIVLSMGKILISAKTSLTLDDIEEIVNSRMSQLLREIYKKVKGWDQSVSADKKRDK